MSEPLGRENAALSGHRPRIYAELLPNIRRVSLAVELPSPSDENTRITVAQKSVRNGDSDWQISIVSVVHQGHKTSLALPAAVKIPEHNPLAPSDLVTQPNHDALFPSLQERIGKTSYNWRLALASRSEDTLGSGFGDFVGVPLSALDFQPGDALYCRRCGRKAAIVPSGRVKAWKDLPDEGWAEMMDFWHCHKPEVPLTTAAQQNHGLQNGEAERTSEDKLASRGYGANTKFAPSPGLALIDISTIWCSTKDCTGVGVLSPQAAFSPLARQQTPGGGTNDSDGLQDVNVYCERCHSAVGIYNARDDTVALFKWRINLFEDNLGSMMPTSEICLSAMLLATMARTGSSKALIMPWQTRKEQDGKNVGKSPVLHIWILNSSIRFSAYAGGLSKAPEPAIKLLYRDMPYAEAEKLLESVIDNVQELTLPLDAIEEVRNGLKFGTSLLPSADQHFQGWHVGLLKRYEKERIPYPDDGA